MEPIANDPILDAALAQFDPITPKNAIQTGSPVDEDALKSFLEGEGGKQLLHEDVLQEGKAMREAATPLVTNLGRYLSDDFGEYKQDWKATNTEQLFDLPEHRGQTQSTFDKWANGHLKFVGKTGINIAGSIAGVAYGLITAPSGGFGRVWDNEVLHSLDAANAWMDGKLPNHYTRMEKEKGLFDQLGTMNFWADKYLNGLSFLAGAALTEVLASFGGPMALAGNTARLTGQASRMFKTMRGVSATSKMATINTAANVAKWTDRIDDTFVLARQVATGAGYEAGVEARHSYETVRDNLISNEIGELVTSTEEALGRSLSLEEKAELLTPEQKRKIDERATSVSNAVFLGNLALVGTSNLLMLPKLYGMGVSKAMATLPKPVTALDKVASKAGLGARGADNLRVAGKMVGRGLYEGVIEEGGQGMLHLAAEDYALVQGLNSDGSFSDMMSSAAQGFSESFGEKEGQTDIMIGTMMGFTGLPVGGMSTFSQSKKDVDERRSIIDLVAKMEKDNPSLLNSIRNNALFFDNVLKRSTLYDEALDRGDIHTTKNIEFDDFFDFVHAKLQTGQFEDIADQTKEILAMSNEEFIAFANDPTLTVEKAGERKVEVARRVVERANRIKEATEKVDSNLRLTEAERLLDPKSNMSKANLRRQLIHAISTTYNIDERESDMISQLSKLTGGKVKGTDFDVDTIEYEEDGETKTVKIGEFSKGRSLMDTREELTDRIEKISKAEQTPETEKALSSLRSKLRNADSLIQIHGPAAAVTEEEFEEIFKKNDAELKAWISENPEQADVNAKEVAELLSDLRKVRSRRQAAARNYKLLLDPKTRFKELQRREAQIKQIQALQTNETEAVKAEKKEAVKKETEKKLISVEKFKEKLGRLKEKKLNQLEDLNAGIVNVTAEMEALQKELEELVEQAKKGKPINRKGKKGRLSREEVTALINEVSDLITIGNDYVSKYQAKIDDINEMIVIMDEFEKNTPDLSFYTGKAEELFEDALIKTITSEEAQGLRDLVEIYTSEQAALTEKIKILEDLRSFLEEELLKALENNQLGIAESTKENIAEVAYGLSVLQDLLKEKTAEKDAYNELLSEAEIFKKLEVVRAILKVKEPKRPPTASDLPFEVAERLRLNADRVPKDYPKPDIDIRFETTAGNHQDALDTYEYLKKKRTELTDAERIDLLRAEAQLNFFNFLHRSDPNQYDVAVIHRGNIPAEFNNEDLRGMFFTDVEKDNDDKGMYADIKLVLFQRSEYDAKLKKSVPVNRFVRSGEGNTGPLVLASVLEPTLLKYKEEEVYYRSTNKDELDETVIRAQHAAWRADRLKSTEITLYPVVGKSVGSIDYAEEAGNALGRIVGSAQTLKNVKLFTATHVNAPGSTVALTIPGTSQHVMTYPGLLWAFDQIRQLAIPMVGRLLNEDEATDISRMIHLLLKKRSEFIAELKDGEAGWKKAQGFELDVNGEKVNIYDAIHDMVFIGSDTYFKGKEGKQFQFRYAKNAAGEWGFVFGENDTSVTLADFESGSANAQLLTDFLQTKYHNFNNTTSKKAVESAQTHEEYSPKWKSTGNKWVKVSLDSDLKPTSKSEVFDNYNEYLLKGTKDSEKAPFQTRVKKILPKDFDDPTTIRFIGGYYLFRKEVRKKGRNPITLQALRAVKRAERKVTGEDRLADAVTQVAKAADRMMEQRATDFADILERVGMREHEISEPEVVEPTEREFDPESAAEEAIERELSGREPVTPESVQRMLEFPVDDVKPTSDELSDEDEVFMRETNELGAGYISETYPEELKRVQGMVTLDVARVGALLSTKDGKAVAQLTSFGNVLISELAPGGALYHEAFHNVSLFILSKGDVKALYDEVRGRSGNTTTYKGEVKALSELTDKEADEWLAEEFRRFILSDGTYFLGKDTVEKNIIQQFFDFVRDMLRAMFNLDNVFMFDPNVKGIEGLFEEIAKGRFRTAHPDVSRDMSISPAMLADEISGNITSSYSRDLVSSLTNYMFRSLESDAYKADAEKNGVRALKMTDMFLMNLPASKEGLGAPLLLLYKHAFNGMIRDYDAQIAATTNKAEKSALTAKKKILSDNTSDATKEDSKKRRQHIFQTHVAFMRQFGLEIDVEEGNADESEVTSRNWVDSAASIEVSPTDSASKMVKILLGTLPNNEKVNLTGLNGVYDMRDVLKIAQNRLQGKMKYADQLAALNELREEKKFPWAEDLLNRLPDHATEGHTFEDIQLRTQFTGWASQSHIKHRSVFIGNNGRIYDLDPNEERILRVIRRRWEANGRIKSTLDNSHIYLNAEGKITFDPSMMSKFTQGSSTVQASLKDIRAKLEGSSLRYKIDALAHLGFEFSDPDKVLEMVEDRERVDDELFSDAITEAAIYLYEDIIKGNLKTFNPFDREESMSVTRFNRLAKIELRTFEQNVEFQSDGPDGKVTYGITLNTYMSTIANTDIEDLDQYFDPVKNPYVAGSLTLAALRKSRNNKIKVHNVGGLGVEGASVRGEKMSKLGATDIAAVQIHILMNGLMPMIRTADQTTEFALEFPIKYPNNLDAAMETIFDYLKDEMISSFKGRVDGQHIKDYADRIQNLRMFSYLNEEVPAVKTFMASEASTEDVVKFIDENRDAIDEAIRKQFKADMIEIQKYLEEYGLVDEVNDKDKRFLRGISRELFKSAEGSMSDTVDEHKFQGFLERLAVRHFVGKTEIFKSILGDPALYKALYKRTKGASGTKKIFIADEQLDNWLNTYSIPTESGENLSIAREQFDGKVSDGTEKIVVIQEPTKVAQYIEEYNRMLEEGKWSARTVIPYIDPADMGDGTMIVSLPAYREMGIRAQEWSPEQEIAYLMEMFPEKYPRKAIEGGAFPPAKFQYFGQRRSFGTDMSPHTYLKMSVVPIYPSLAMKDGKVHFPEIMEMYGYMMDNSMGGLVLPSAVKIGGPAEGQLEDGTDLRVPAYVNTLDANGKKIQLLQLPKTAPQQVSILDLDYRFMGSQLDVSSKFKGKAPIATQARVQVLADLYAGGTLRFPELEGDIEVYHEAYNTLMKREFKSLLDTFGLEVSSKEGEEMNFKLKEGGNYKAFLDAIEKEAVARELPKALLDSIDYMRTRDAENHPVLFDMIVNKGRMEGVLWSLAGKRVIKQKFKGDQYVQMSSIGFGVRAQEGTGNVIEDRLGFYTNEKGNFEMEVYLPHHFKELIGTDVSINKKGQIVDSENKVIGEKGLLDLIGIRIPTDGPHSVEVIRVKGFLPLKAGPTVVVPSELITKAGSDFDIDKLVLYFPSYKMKGGKLVREEMEMSMQAWFEERKRVATEKYLAIREIIGADKKEETDAMLDRLMANIFGTEMLSELAEESEIDLSNLVEAKQITPEQAEKIYTRAIDTYNRFNVDFEQWQRSNPDTSIYTVASKGALQNKVMESMKKFLTYESQKDSFMRPVSTDDMNDLSDRILSLYKDNSNGSLKDLSSVSDYHTETSMPHMLRATEAFWKGKALVGIAALASTHHVKSQIAGLEMVLENNENEKSKFRTVDNRNLNFGIRMQGFDPEAYTLDLGREWDVRSDRKVTDVISQIVNASVDVVNNPILHILNLSPDNAPAWLILVRAGVPLNTTGFFMNQPVVKDYMKAMEINRSRVFRGLQESELPEKALKDVQKKYGTTRSENVELFSEEQLEGMVGREAGQLSDLEKSYQLQILDDFMTYSEMGDLLGNAVQAQSFDTKIPKNRHHLKAIQVKYNRLVESGILKNVQSITEGNTFMREMTAYNFNMSNMFRDLFLTEQAGAVYDRMYDRMVSMYTDQRVRMSNEDVAKVLSKFEEDFVTFLLQTMADSSGATMGNKIEAMMFGENSMAMRLARIQQDPSHPLHSNTFIQSLVPVMSTNRTGADRTNDYILPVSRTMTTFEYNTIFDGFREIEEQAPNIAKDLVHTAFFQAGTGQSPYSFLETIPGSSFMRLGEQILGSFLKNPAEIDVQKFYTLFFQNNLDNTLIVPKGTKKTNAIFPVTFKYKGGKVFKVNKALDGELALSSSVAQVGINRKGSVTLKNYTSRYFIPKNQVSTDLSIEEIDSEDTEQDRC